MKKLFIGIAFVFACVMASCNGGHKTETVVEDTTVVEEVVVPCDSTNSDTVVCDSVPTTEAETE